MSFHWKRVSIERSRTAFKLPVFVFCYLGMTLALISCQPYPKDPAHSLQDARAEKLLVGAVHAPPWVIVRDENISGREVTLMNEFADTLGTEIEWVRGNQEELMSLLKAREIHIVIGGLTKSNPWKKHVGITRPYYKETVIVCSPAGQDVPLTIKGVTVAIEPGSPFAIDVRREGGTPVTADGNNGTSEFVAVEESDAGRAGCLGMPRMTLSTHAHVMAVPPGENGLLMALEAYLDEQGY